MSYKPSIPKGTRDFGPAEMVKRNFIFNTIQSVFQKYGYLPVETPAMEKLETLTGKYGEEGDRLIFKVLARGRKLEKALESGNSGKLSEEALRYDLTVPFARYVVQHQHELNFPFKRYQVQPVWRADRPQRGRYREFYQCDVDVIGSDSLLNEVELVQIMDEVFSELNIDVTIKLNNRKILQGICEVIGVQDKFTEFTVILDKLDKIGPEKVFEELGELGISQKGIEIIASITTKQPSGQTSGLSFVENEINTSVHGRKGLEELQMIFNTLKALDSKVKLEFDPTLARGLNYYTGAIFEVVTNDFPSSICGGGRYDDLTGIFGLPDVSGVGVSFGADRIYDVMEQNNLFPESVAASVKVMFVNFGEPEANYCLGLLRRLRKSNIAAELFPDAAKMKKQMKYADAKNMPYVVMVGSKEMESGKLSVKNMIKGQQQELTFDELLSELQQ